MSCYISLGHTDSSFSVVVCYVSTLLYYMPIHKYTRLHVTLHMYEKDKKIRSIQVHVSMSIHSFIHHVAAFTKLAATDALGFFVFFIFLLPPPVSRSSSDVFPPPPPPPPPPLAWLVSPISSSFPSSSRNE